MITDDESRDPSPPTLFAFPSSPPSVRPPSPRSYVLMQVDNYQEVITPGLLSTRRGFMEAQGEEGERPAVVMGEQEGRVTQSSPPSVKSVALGCRRDKLSVLSGGGDGGAVTSRRFHVASQVENISVGGGGVCHCSRKKI